MPIFQKLLSFTMSACFALLVFLSFVGCSSHEFSGRKRINNNVHKVTHFLGIITSLFSCMCI